MLTKTEAKQLIDKVLSYSKADACQVSLREDDSANTRFANNAITTAGAVRSISISISSTKGTQTGTSATNETSDAALKTAVAKSEELASFATPDPEYVPPLGPQKYPEIAAYDQKTAAAAQPEMIPGVRAAITGSEEKKLNSAGFFERETINTALGTSAGNFGHHLRTSVEYSMTARTPDGTGSGWAADNANRFADIDAPAVARVAIDKAVLSQKPRPIDPGLYTVVLEPAAVRDLMAPMLGFGSAFDARAAEEGRSLMTKKGGGTRLGEKVFSEKITIVSDPFDARNPAMPWAFGGIPTRKITWVEKGVVKNLTYSRYWAQKKEVEPTPNMGAGLIIQGEDHTLDDLIKATDRGLLITHFWYIRFLNPQTVQLTGLTRDGVFMIENGKIAYPVMNFRWNESPANSLNKVEMMTREQRAGNSLVPAMKLSEFPVSSLSDAV